MFILVIELGKFSKSFKTGTTTTDDNCLVTTGNEYPALQSLAAGITITGAAATQSAITVSNAMQLQQTRLVLRPTTAVVDAGTTAGTIKVSWAVSGTSTLVDGNAAITVNTSNLGTGTTATTDFVFNAQTITPGSYVVLRHTQAAGGSPAGVINATAYVREKQI